MLRYAQDALKHAVSSHDFELEGQGRLTKRSRRLFVDYDTDLRVWDLVLKGKTPAEIARELFPKELPSPAAQKVRDHFKRARRLVLRDYQDLR